MFHVVLFEPEIPPNTGNIIRLCANTGSMLHLIHPLGFDFDDKKLRRAGLDYHEFANVQQHDNLEAFLNNAKPKRVFAISTKGKQRYDQVDYQDGDVFMMGPETRGLPMEVIESLPEDQRLRLPMLPDQRSLNLSNATAILLYEAWRHTDFEGGI